MRAALYARVSTADQDNAMQIRELMRYAFARGWQIFGVFEDHMSGAAARPGLTELMELARRRAFDVVIVWKLDRFGRSNINLHENIAALNAAGVRFIAITQGLDTDESNPVSRFLMQILGAVAELEREMICERVRAGVENAKRKGTRLGRPAKIFDRGAVPSLTKLGHSIREVARLLEISTATVRRELARQNPRPETSGKAMKTQPRPGA